MGGRFLGFSWVYGYGVRLQLDLLSELLDQLSEPFDLLLVRGVSGFGLLQLYPQGWYVIQLLEAGSRFALVLCPDPSFGLGGFQVCPGLPLGFGYDVDSAELFEHFGDGGFVLPDQKYRVVLHGYLRTQPGGGCLDLGDPVRCCQVFVIPA